MARMAGSRFGVIGAVWLASVAILTATSIAPAGEVVFKNGDRLTGKVTTATDGKLTIESAIAGKVVVNMSDVKSFSTDEPVDLVLKDGSTVKQQVTTAPSTADGTITTAGGTVAPQAFALGDVVAINPPPKDTGWKGDVAAGAIFQSGNSESTSVSVEANAARRREDDRFTLKGQYLFDSQKDKATDETSTTTDSYLASAQYDYFLTKKLYVFGRFQAERDRVADLEFRGTGSLGLGYQWVESAKTNISTELGLGYTYEDYKSQESRDFVSARAAYHIDHKLWENVGVFHNMEYLPSLEDFANYKINADGGLRFEVNANLFTQLKMEWKYDSQPAGNKDSSDFRYLMQVGWKF
jgi:putative salt-induced outer membrane protein YdiY